MKVDEGGAMFRGSSSHNLDLKGRLIIPARFKDVLKQSCAEALMVTRMDGAIFCYNFEEWRKIEERVLSQAVRSGNMRRFRRIFLGGAFECPIDKQGRILIPLSLRQYAGLQKEVVLVGALQHFEIWSKESWFEEDNKFQSDVQKEDMRNEIAEIGL